MARMVMRALDAAFGRPRGLAGRLGGAVMARANAQQEQWAATAAGLRSGTRVLAVGHGPGVGLRLLADAVAPDGQVVGVDPSPTMRRMAASRCTSVIAAGLVEVRDGTAEQTGCADASMDAAISVNNVMLWDKPTGFTELFRVLRPGARLVITVHRHVLDVASDELVKQATVAGFDAVEVRETPRRFVSPAVEIVARRPESAAGY